MYSADPPMMVLDEFEQRALVPRGVAMAPHVPKDIVLRRGYLVYRSNRDFRKFIVCVYVCDIILCMCVYVYVCVCVCIVCVYVCVCVCLY